MERARVAHGHVQLQHKISLANSLKRPGERHVRGEYLCPRAAREGGSLGLVHGCGKIQSGGRRGAA